VFGLPGLSIFGAHLSSKHLVALLAATLFLGLKGFLIGICIWIVYKLSQQGEAPLLLAVASASPYVCGQSRVCNPVRV
jgi:hypothetical protein